MTWDELVEAAQAISWVTYLGTADGAGRAHVSAVAPGFSPGTIWIATRPQSKKAGNIRENPSVGFHWPVTGGGPGELAAWGTAVLHEDQQSKSRIWHAGYMTYDLADFFQSEDNPDLLFIEVAVERARLLGPDFAADVWRRA